jgi:glycine/D-amino acid oxidase-like deaminating enzyme/nitrite reductase/ring-hydroxylating ferredoxin subunit
MATGNSNNAGAVLTSGENLSFWTNSSEPIEFEALVEDLTTNVLIIGGGIAGLTTAYLLTKEGIEVTLVEDGLIGSGESGRTTAHLTHALDDRYYNIERVHGEQASRLAAESHTAAIDWIEQTVRAENISCHFQRVNGYLFVHPSDAVENLQKEFEATQRAGLSTKMLDHVPALSAETGPCLLYPNQAQFHILLYLKAIAEAVIRMGGHIYTRTRARHITENGAECNGFHVSARHVVVATNSPVNDFATMHTKQIPFRTYVIGAMIPKGTLPPALWWDTGDQQSKWFTAPYHYVRIESFNDQYDLLIAGGEDHKTGQADEENVSEESRYAALIQWTRAHFPMMQDIVYKWSGQVLEPLDYLAFIGRNPGNDHVYIITGDSGNGMTHGTLGGLIVTDLIMNRENPWTEIYSPKRIPLKVAGTWISEAFNMASQYGDWVAKADISGLSELGLGEGAILGEGVRKYAVYKDEQGRVQAFSASCSHMGCVVQWNAEEKSFDCPCHGSRYTKDGEVINGPASIGLKQIEIKDILV